MFSLLLEDGSRLLSEDSSRLLIESSSNDTGIPVGVFTGEWDNVFSNDKRNDVFSRDNWDNTWSE